MRLEIDTDTAKEFFMATIVTTFIFCVFILLREKIEANHRLDMAALALKNGQAQEAPLPTKSKRY